MASSLELLKQLTVVVADTGDFEAMRKFQPQDATTNPSLILAASGMEQYKPIVDQAIAFGKEELAKNGGVVNDDIISKTVDKMFVLFGCEILKIVPGKTFIPSLFGALSIFKKSKLKLSAAVEVQF